MIEKIHNEFKKIITGFSVIITITQADISSNLLYGNINTIDNNSGKKVIKNYYKERGISNWRLKKHLNKKSTAFVADKFGYLVDKENDYIDDSLIPLIPKIENITLLIKNYPQLRKYGIKQDSIFIFRIKELNSKFVLLYYRNGILQIGTFVSPGKRGHYTPKKEYKSGYKEIVHYSKKYKFTPMPYSIHLKGGYFLHMGGKVDGYPHSHGCIRVAGVAMKELFEDIDNKEKIPVIFNGYSSL